MLEPEHNSESLISSWYVPRLIPEVGPPFLIRKDWIDIPLPLRYDRPIERPDPMVGADLLEPFVHHVYRDAVSVIAIDAIKSLHLFNRQTAANWWKRYYENNRKDPTTCRLLFDTAAGDLLPYSLVTRLLPGIEEFDCVRND